MREDRLADDADVVHLVGTGVAVGHAAGVAQDEGAVLRVAADQAAQLGAGAVA